MIQLIRTLYNDKGEKVGEITGKFFKDVSVGKDSQVKVTAYNSVYVPYGKTFELVLFDGTRVLLIRLNIGLSVFNC